MKYPERRLRRLRRSASLRDLVSETSLNPAQMIMPIFVVPGKKNKSPINSLPGLFYFSPDLAALEAKELFRLGIKSVILFGLPSRKDSKGSAALDPKGIVPNAIREIKHHSPETLVVADLCFCEYTDHGHCGILDKNGVLDNDRTLIELNKQALVLAKAGADILAPSGMLDGMVTSIRSALDQDHFSDIAIMSYAVKYASAFYGPFRDAVKSAPSKGDRKSYQMDPRSLRQALLEAKSDIDEGADFLMVKPALSFLDIISKVREICDLPLVAYNVSGEYSMVKSAAKAGYIDHDAVVLEMLTSIKRAGADIIISYFAKYFARNLSFVI